jgi:hypothetical protein
MNCAGAFAAKEPSDFCQPGLDSTAKGRMRRARDEPRMKKSKGASVSLLDELTNAPCEPNSRSLNVALRGVGYFLFLNCS